MCVTRPLVIEIVIAVCNGVRPKDNDDNYSTTLFHIYIPNNGL